MTNAIFVDANVFLRFFTLDEAGQHRRAAELFNKAASGKVILMTGPPVLFEIAWTLRSAYNQPREQVLEVLGSILNLPCMTMVDFSLVEEAIELARKSGREFADAYIVASANKAGNAEIATFNVKHFEKLGAKLYRF